MAPRSRSPFRVPSAARRLAVQPKPETARRWVDQGLADGLLVAWTSGLTDLAEEARPLWDKALAEGIVLPSSPDSLIREFLADHGSLQRTTPKRLPDLLPYLQGQHLQPMIRLWGAFDDSFRGAAEDLTKQALAKGLTQEQYELAVADLAARYGANLRSSYAATWYRTYVLNLGYNQAQVEMLRTTPAGRLFPYIRFRTRKDELVRPAHRRLHGLTMLSTSPLWAYLRPPLDWNCRCWLQKISWLTARAEGLSGLAPEGEVYASEFLDAGGSPLELV